MCEPGSKRRAYQFSLRQLFLWTAIVALLLGVLKALSMGACASVSLAGYLVIVYVLRVAYGPKIACMFAVMTVVPTLCLSLVYGVFTGHPLWRLAPADTLLVMMAIGIVLGCVLGMIGFALVEIVFRTVEWIDRFIETKHQREVDT